MLRCVAYSCLAGAWLAAGCGKTGPPLAPLRLVPAAATGVTARRLADEVQVRFVLPTRNQNGIGGIDLDRVEIYAMSIAPCTPPPPNRELLTPRYVVGTIDVKPAPVEGDPPPEDSAADTRPSPGETVTFTEKLTEGKVKPATRASARPARPAVKKTGSAEPGPAPCASLPGVLPGVVVPVAVPGAFAPVVLPGVVVSVAAPGAAVAGALAPVVLPGVVVAVTVPGALARVVLPGVVVPVPGAVGAPAPAPDMPAEPVRIYAIRGMAKGGRPGPASPRLQVPLVAPPPPPSAVTATNTETALVITWTAPAAGDPPRAIGYNVYKPEADVPVNPEALTAPTLERGVVFGVEQCFAIRTSEQHGTVSIESDAVSVCHTPRDTFPPAAPTRLDTVSDAGVIHLIWEANTEADLAGYLLLRGEAPGDTLQTITLAPIRETHYDDRTVKPGVRYAYVVVAVDRASPPNMSAQSARREETAR